MIVRRATAADGDGDALLSLVTSGIGHERHVDPEKLRRFVKAFCSAQGDVCAMVGEEGGALLSVAAGIVVDHPWLRGKQLQVVALTGKGGSECLSELETWARGQGADGEFLTLNPDKRYDRWAREEGFIPVRCYWRPSWQ